MDSMEIAGPKHMMTEHTLNEQSKILGKRVRELNCLYAIFDFIEKHDVLEDLDLEILVNLIPTGWEYPEITCARITVENDEFKTKNFRKTTWNLTSNIIVNRKCAGTIEVCYLRERPESDIGPFHNEEVTLINIIAERLGDNIQRRRAEEKLKVTMKELTISNEELEHFAFVTSHDLQEPLRMITNYLMLLELRYKDKLDDEAEEFIEYAVKGATRMYTLINDLLSYSRISTKGKEFKPINTKEVFDHALDNLKVAIDESGAVINHDPFPIIVADDVQIGLLYQNLIGNAIKFKGSDPPNIQISVKQRSNEWIFSVRDNGIGIDPKYTDNIFTMFQRLHSNSEIPGTGLGLAISKKIVERHGGSIWVESEPDAGSTFYFTIPENGGERK